MTGKVKKFIEEQKLLESERPDSNTRIIAGLSGGADSVVLLYILHRAGYECLAAHCNFHLRGAESDRDEQFARELTASWNIPFFKQDFPTRTVASGRGISIEMAARDLRYEWFEQLREEQHAHAVAVAHHRDDSIETVLLNLIRGTGIKGLTGIKPKNGNIIRPLLCVSKKEILQFAGKESLPYITDSSNLQDEYLRNKIRLTLIPLMQSIDPAFDTSLLRTMENLGETEKIYDEYIAKAKEKVFHPVEKTIDIPALQALASPEPVLFEILKDYGFGPDRIRNVAAAINSQPGKEFYSSGYLLVKDRTRFLLSSLEQKDGKNSYEISENRNEIRQPLPLRFTFEPVSGKFEIIKDAKTACFDADKLQFPLRLRKWEKGDRFVPFGINGFQKLSDYFNNHKFSKPQKKETWLLCSGDDIIWIVGHRTDNRYKVNDGTKRVCVFKLF
ncbi:MAG: tRNA lysidine(34) synthetase TilS [Dysgonamonadaceae bacterium]|jgi:tRNA(Ile)-lysidine synthase|nr:tRNA lysidine(34) synthetase TilS [Dysgonamonadaceae bacterium]